MRKYLLIYIIIFAVLISCNKKEEKYISLVNAPSTKEPIADYEKIFKPEEKAILIKKIERIEKLYGIKIRILTLPSFFYFEPVGSTGYGKRENAIFGLNSQDKFILFEFSEKEKRFAWATNDHLRKIMNDKKIEYISSTISNKYFDSKKYYIAFKQILEAIEKELQGNMV